MSKFTDQQFLKTDQYRDIPQILMLDLRFIAASVQTLMAGSIGSLMRF